MGMYCMSRCQGEEEEGGQQKEKPITNRPDFMQAILDETENSSRKMTDNTSIMV